MKLLLFLIGCIIGIWLGNEYQPQVEPYLLNNDCIFILKSVEKDTILQRMILDPTYRLRIKQAEKELK